MFFVSPAIKAKQSIHSLNSITNWVTHCQFILYELFVLFQVHKILLAATSDYFRAMLLSPTKESQENTVDMKGLSASALQHMIDFIYTGQLELDFENLIEMLNAASHLQVDDEGLLG